MADIDRLMFMAWAATPTLRVMTAASSVSSAAVRYSAIADGVSSVAAASKGSVLVSRIIQP